ncbi:MAG: hypothetical protein GC185_00770 [Alphaproteobacteria bacterium]|nr:hypothetical protein [Alphaproteobacteria bacterium]
MTRYATRARLFAAAILAALALAAARPACAQLLKQQKPKPTQARYIAMLYDKLTAHMPDFDAWARATPAYKNAPLVKKAEVETATGKDLLETFTLMTVSEPIVMTAEAQISAYSTMGNGFLMQNFNDMSFFDYEYDGERYALVPNGIVDYQWLHDLPSDNDNIMRETKNGYHAQMVFTLVPLRADPKPMEMGGVKYHLILADISKIEMWSADGSRVIWDSTMNDPTSVKSRLMNMYNP